MSELSKRKKCSKCGSIARFYDENPFLNCNGIVGYDKNGNAIRCNHPFDQNYIPSEEEIQQKYEKPKHHVIESKVKVRKKRTEKGRICSICGTSGHNARTCPSQYEDILDLIE